MYKKLNFLAETKKNKVPKLIVFYNTELQIDGKTVFNERVQQ